MSKDSNKEEQSKKLIGTWTFVAFEARSSRGTIIHPLGTDPYGLLMFDTDRNFSAFTMRRDRPTFAVNDASKGTPNEIKAAFEGLIAYCGTYDVNDEKGVLTYHIEGSWFPNLAGQDQVRFFEFSDDQLIVKTPPVPAGDEQWTIYAVLKRRA